MLTPTSGEVSYTFVCEILDIAAVQASDVSSFSLKSFCGWSPVTSDVSVLYPPSPPTFQVGSSVEFSDD